MRQRRIRLKVFNADKDGTKCGQGSKANGEIVGSGKSEKKRCGNTFNADSYGRRSVLEIGSIWQNPPLMVGGACTQAAAAICS